MKMKFKSTTITLIIIYIFLISAVIGGYFAFTNSFFNDFANSYATQNREIHTEKINEIIKYQYNNYYNNPNNSEVIDNGTISNNKITYGGFVIDLDYNQLNKYNIAIRQGYLFIINNNDYGVVNLELILIDAITHPSAAKLLLMDKTGRIYYNNGGSQQTLLDFLNDDTTPLIDNYFKLHKTGVLKAKHEGQSVYLSFMPMSNYNDLFLIEVFNQSQIIPAYRQYNNMFIGSIVIFTFIVIGIQIYIYKSIHIENAEIEDRKVKYLYNKPYLIKINFKGKIKKTNKKVKNDIQGIKDISHVNEFNIVDFNNQKDVTSLIKREDSFTVSFENTAIRFIPLKYRNGYHLVGEDVSNYEEEIEEMRILAFYDSVTRQPNYNMLKKDIYKHITSNEYDHLKTAMVIFDIKDFNFINKVFGKISSDTILYNIGQTLKSFSGKYKGLSYNSEEDKFVIFFKDNSKDQVLKFVDEIFKEFERPFVLEHNKIDINLNAGIYFYEVINVDTYAHKRIYDALILALKKAKESSSINYIIYDEKIKLNYLSENIMAKDLIKAIDEEEITVYLQPQYNNNEQRIKGFEALVRWNNPKYLKTSPQSFIEIAEHNNLIIPMGKLIMKQTFRLAKKLEEYDVELSINISPVQILQDGFVNEFLKMYNSFELKDNSIAVEVTETFVISSLRNVNEKLKILKANGIGIHLDDFGTGYSSMPYLKELAIDTVKIDRTFIRYLETDKKDREIVKMLINLLNALDFNIIGEGIEDDYQNNYLYKNGCDVVQGYIVSPAVPYEQALKLLREYNVDKTKNLVVNKRRRSRL